MATTWTGGDPAGGGGMTRWQRVQAALAGGEVDRAPLGLWGHDYRREGSAAGLAAAMLDQVRSFDLDYLKVNPRASCFVEDWGCAWAAVGEGDEEKPRLLRQRVHSAGDWQGLERLDPTGGVRGELLDGLRLIVAGLEESGRADPAAGPTPAIQTVFSPLTIAGYLVGQDFEQLLAWLRGPEAPLLQRALALIAEIHAAYAAACVRAGARGIFFAISSGYASPSGLSRQEYRDLCTPHDLRVLEAVAEAPFNVLHLCGAGVYLELADEYPVAAVNWDLTLDPNPSLEAGARRTGRAVMGGIDHKGLMVRGPVEEITAQAGAAAAANGGRHLLVAPGCSVPAQAPKAHWRAVRDGVA